MGIENDGRIENDLLLKGLAVHVLIIGKRGLAGWKQVVHAFLVCGHHIQGAGPGIVKLNVVFSFQNPGRFLVLKQAGLFPAEIAAKHGHSAIFPVKGIASRREDHHRKQKDPDQLRLHFNPSILITCSRTATSASMSVTSFSTIFPSCF